MKIIVKGQLITLNKNDFLASGGQGDIYTKNRIAYKIYQDPSKIIPEGKINELSLINNINVIKPQDIIINERNKPIGYTMRFIPETYALCQLFTKAFRNRHNITHDQIQELVKKLHTLIHDIHSAKTLIVDLNELNFLSSKDFSEIYAIDTDSYQTKSYPATAIMDSIKDRHSKIFSENTDWFSYGIISFQMFTGIHPYKGKHPSIKGLDERMQKNISVFNKDISIPGACYPFTVIPESYRNWYKAIFDDGKRLPPPSSFDIIEIIFNVDIITGNDNIDISIVQECDGNIISAQYISGIKVLTNKFFYNTEYKKIPVTTNNYCIFSSPYGTVLLGVLKNEKLHILNTSTQKEIPCTIDGQSIMSYDGNMYVKSNDRIFLIDMVEINNNIIISSKIVATVLENSSKFFDGVLIQNIVGSFYISIFQESGIHHQIQIKELDNHRIVDAKYDANVLMIIVVDKLGKYDRLVFRFDKLFSSYDMRKIEGITPVGINFVVLDNGITICVNENDNIEICSSKKDSTGLKVLQDKTISADMKLFKSGSNLLFAKQNRLYSAKMK